MIRQRKDRDGLQAQVFHITAGNYDTDTLIQVLGELRRFLGGGKATLLWDGLPAHRSNAMRAWIRTNGPGWWSSGCRRMRRS